MSTTTGLTGKRVFVTGHTGFSGVWLVSLLTQLGAEVKGYSRDDTDFSTIFTPGKLEKTISTTFAAVENFDHLAAEVKNFQPHLILHLAAQSLVLRSYSAPLETFSTNVLGTVNILEAGKQSDSLQGVLIVTTDKVYAEGGEVKTEDSPLGGVQPYSCSKVAAEEAVKAFRKTYSNLAIPLCVMRGGNIIGGGDWSKNRLVPDLIRSIIEKQQLQLRYPSATRPWQHVLDLTYAYCLVAIKMISDEAHEANSEFNVGPSKEASISVKELLNLFSDYGWKCKSSFSDPNGHEVTKLAINSNKFSKTFSWTPVLAVDEAVRWTSDWYRDVLVNDRNPYDVTRDQIERFLRILNGRKP